MIGRFVLAALVAGLIAGGVLTVIQNMRLTPQILAAEIHQQADDAKKEAAAGQEQATVPA